MNLFVINLFFLTLSTLAVYANSDSEISENDIELPRYLVFPGVDAGEEEIGEWNFGFASPFNVFFGPKPYVLGWMGEAPFGPVDEGEEGEDDYIEGEEEIEIGEEGEEEIEEGEEGEVEGDNPGYPDYESI